MLVWFIDIAIYIGGQAPREDCFIAKMQMIFAAIPLLLLLATLAVAHEEGGAVSSKLMIALRPVPTDI